MRSFWLMVTLILLSLQLSNSQSCGSFTSEYECENSTSCGWFNNTCSCISGGRLDIIFGIDTSGSVGAENFEKMKGFISDVVTTEIDLNTSRIGFTTFATTATASQHIQEWDRDVVGDYVNGIFWTRGWTNTPELLSSTITQFRNRFIENRQQILVLITDGFPCLPVSLGGCPLSVCAYDMLLKFNSVRVVIVAIHQYGYDLHSLRCLTNNLMVTKDFNETNFQAIRSNLSELLCPLSPNDQNHDFVYNITMVPSGSTNKWIDDFEYINANYQSGESWFYPEYITERTDDLGSHISTLPDGVTPVWGWWKRCGQNPTFYNSTEDPDRSIARYFECASFGFAKIEVDLYLCVDTSQYSGYSTTIYYRRSTQGRKVIAAQYNKVGDHQDWIADAGNNAPGTNCQVAIQRAHITDTFNVSGVGDLILISISWEASGIPHCDTSHTAGFNNFELECHAITISPTMNPTVNATLQQPTLAPSSNPTISPTNSPSLSPITSLPPTNTPTISPTLIPQGLCCSCTTAQSTPGCNTDQECEAIICDINTGDDFCCNFKWAGGCAASATDICNGGTTLLPTTHLPTKIPTNGPTLAPTNNPTFFPTLSPTHIIPTTSNPTTPPSLVPKFSPSISPTIPPSSIPISVPTSPLSIAPTLVPTIPSINPTAIPSITPTLIPTTKPTLAIQPSIIPTTSFPSTVVTTYTLMEASDFPTEKSLIASTEYRSKNNVGSETENIFQNKHLLIVFSISFMLFIILFIVICVLCICMIKFKNTIKTIKSENVPQDDHDNDLELQIENANPNPNSLYNLSDEQKLQNDDENQYINGSDSEGEELNNYKPMPQNLKTKMEIEMLKSNMLHQSKQKLQNDGENQYIDGSDSEGEELYNYKPIPQNVETKMEIEMLKSNMLHQSKQQKIEKTKYIQ